MQELERMQVQVIPVTSSGYNRKQSDKRSKKDPTFGQILERERRKYETRKTGNRAG